jgi:hypothetical protein
MPLSIVKPKILAGESLSDAVDLTSGSAAIIVVPANWLPANITFQLSLDNTTFADFFDSNAREVMKMIEAGTVVNLDPSGDASATIRNVWLKIRSGARDHPVVQPEDVEFQLAIAT